LNNPKVANIKNIPILILKSVLLKNNIPIEQVSKWLGHVDISSTKIYGKITKSRLDLTAEKLNKNY
jgi:site-specific recombinase XerD